MIKDKLHRVFLICFAIFAGLVILILASKRPSVLVIHSYHPSYYWSEHVDHGFRKALRGKSFYKVHTHYMHTKLNTSAKFRKMAARRALQLIKDVNPTVIVLFDDNAQVLVGKQLAQEGRIPIIYAGVNADPANYGYHVVKDGEPTKAPIGGIKEATSLEVIESLVDYNRERGNLPDHPRIIHLADQSSSVFLDDAHLKNLRHYFKSFLVKTEADWQAVIRQAHLFCDLILISNYQNIRKSSGAPALGHELIDFALKNAKVPILGINGFVFYDGVDVAIGTSPLEQGRIAGELVIGYVKDKGLHKVIPTYQAKEVFVYIKGFPKGKKKMIYPPIFEAFARATGHFIE